MTEFSQLLSKLSPAKRELLLSRINAGSIAKRQTITPRKIDYEPIPLSFSQLRLWFFTQVDPGNTTYHIKLKYRLTGNLDVAALQYAFDEVINRHEVLRTNFSSKDGVPAQIVHPKVNFKIQYFNLSHIDDTKKKLAIDNIVLSEKTEPFDLVSDLLVRATLIGLNAQEHILIITVHHIVFDGFSVRIFRQDLSKHYNDFVQKETNKLPFLHIQYADYSIWQRDNLREGILRDQLLYWKEQLKDLPVLTLPTDYERPTLQTYRGAKVAVKVSPELMVSLKALCQQEGVTVFMFLISVLSVLLSRYCGQEDIVIGFPIAGRNRQELETMIGFFVNTLVLRINLEDDPTFRELLQQVKGNALQAYDNQDVPFEKLVEELNPCRDLSRTALVQTMLNYSNFEAGASKFIGCETEALTEDDKASIFDINLYAFEFGNNLRLEFVYNEHLFKRTSAKLFLKDYLAILESVIADTSQALTVLPLKNDNKRRKALNRPLKANLIPNFGGGYYKSITERFAEQVTLFGNNTAVSSSNHKWTYNDLDQYSNRLSDIIKNCGSRSAFICLLFNHDAPMIGAIIGILKSGKAYMPLDASMPRERLLYVINHSNAEVLVTDEENYHAAIDLAPAKRIINIETIVRTAQVDAKKEIGSEPENEPLNAYVLYTSGTSGKPKGVLQNHTNLLKHIATYSNALNIKDTDRLSLIPLYNVDAAVMDIFAALLNGATLQIYDLRRSGFSNMATWVNENEVSVLHFTPTVFRNFISSLPQRCSFPNTRTIVLGGEPVYKDDFYAYKRVFKKDAILVNGLGPTESTLALQKFLTKRSKPRGLNIPVGSPVHGTEILVLNRRDQKVSTYAKGEIFIRSDKLSIGYWNDPVLTSEAFVDLNDGSGRRTYKTGDLGRVLPNNEFEYIGRKDLQVKIRGHRIELGEIEANILQLDAVREAAVAIYESGLHEKCIVAFVVPATPAKNLQQLIFDHLKNQLPQYMIPYRIALQDRLPKTLSGKIDRRNLDFELIKTAGMSSKYEAPETEIEEVIIEIWKELLKIEQVGISDNFFDLGGHSLLLLLLKAKMENALDTKINVLDLFRYPTISSFALFISAGSSRMH